MQLLFFVFLISSVLAKEHNKVTSKRSGTNG